MWFTNEKRLFSIQKFSLLILWTAIILSYLPVHSPEMRKNHILLLSLAKRSPSVNLANALMLDHKGRWYKPPNSYSNLWDHLMTSLFDPRERSSVMFYQDVNTKHLWAALKTGPNELFLITWWNSDPLDEKQRPGRVYETWPLKCSFYSPFRNPQEGTNAQSHAMH